MASNINRPLWVQKLSDEQLRKLLSQVWDFEISGVIQHDEVRHIINTWYDQNTGMEKMMACSIDVWKEAAFRWARGIRVER